MSEKSSVLATLRKFSDVQSLVMNSGVQFLDFGLSIDWNESEEWRKKRFGYFVSSSENGPLRRLVDSYNGEGYCDPSDLKRLVEPQSEIKVEDSLKLFNEQWLPIPVFRTIPPDRFDKGPFNWARARIVKLDTPDEDGNTHRVTLAFDTKVFPNRDDVAYLSPTEEDVRSAAHFSLAYQSDQMDWFLDISWVNEWLLELFTELAPEPERLKINVEELDEEIAEKSYQGHYLNLLSVLGEGLSIPKLKILSNKPDDAIEAIPVDMVIDVGNSRTCAVLVEEHKQSKDSLKRRYELELRDLTHPEKVYVDPFESRVEFSQAFFGKEHFSVRSGRRDAFQWPTIVRVGKEAGRLASRREGNEGSTGLSSPKRYLWDLQNYEMRWRFNTSYVKSDSEPFATSEPFASLINDTGEALYTLSDDIPEEFDRKLPVFQPEYSRSSLMMFMMSEVIMHALAQINSPSQRAKLEHAHTPRHLRSVILTIPPAMPKPEQAIFKESVEQAIALVWKCLGWNAMDAEIDFSKKETANCYPLLPEVVIEWDEATCGQVVYLFNETQNNYGGRPEEFFKALRRPDKKEGSNSITVATVDIGGGTTDLVINDYTLEGNLGAAASTSIQPKQRFRDGFRVAGDDILLEIIRLCIIDSLESYLGKKGLSNDAKDSLLSGLIGAETGDVSKNLLRQQLTLQVFSPAGITILAEYEKYDRIEDNDTLKGKKLGDLLSLQDKPTDAVMSYINEPIQRMLNDPDFCLLNIPLTFKLSAIHDLFLRGHFDICKTFTALGEVINAYQCDVLLLTGRSSRLPGVQSFFRTRLSLPVGRILPMYHYRTGNWYPFHKNGRIDDPKTTAVVGAMLCFLSKDSRLTNFNFRPSALKAYSTLKYLGLLDGNNVMKDSAICYRDINLDNESYNFPEEPFTVRGSCCLGFKQIDIERWVATPLYKLNITSKKLQQKLDQDNDALQITLGMSRGRKGNKELFRILTAETSSGSNVKKDIELVLNTMTDQGLNESQFWLDTGSIRR